MPPPPAGTKAKGSGLTRKVGGLPVWAWAGLGGVGLFVLIRLRAARAASQSQTTATPTTNYAPPVADYSGGGGGYGGAFGGIPSGGLSSGSMPPTPPLPVPAQGALPPTAPTPASIFIPPQRPGSTQQPSLINTATGRPAFSGPAGEGGYAPWDPNKPANAVLGPYGAYYVPGSAPQAGNVGALQAAGLL